MKHVTLTDVGPFILVCQGAYVQDARESLWVEAQVEHSRVGEEPS
jgi:hypothetical protein